MRRREAVAAVLSIMAALAAVGLHGYVTYIAYHDGTLAALITFVTPPLSELFWFGAAWHAAGTPFTLYGTWFIAVAVLYAAGSWLARED
jgi:hypothetical protein